MCLEDIKGGWGRCAYCGGYHNNVSYHEAHDCLYRPCEDCGKTQDQCDCGIEYCEECGEEIGGMCVCQAVPSSEEDTTPTEQFAKRMEEVQTQMEAGPKRERIINMLKAIVKEIDYDSYKGLFVIPEDPEYAEETIEELIRIVQSHQG